MDLGLRGCVGLVAAASRGLGYAAAEALAKEGADVALFSRNAEAAARASAQIASASGRRVLGLGADVTQPAQLADVVGRTIRELGRLDVLVTNAGGPPPGPFEAHDDAAWQRAFELNLMSAVRLVRLAQPHLERSGRGRVILISSTTIKQPEPGLILSNAVRIGLAGLGKSLSVELAPQSITVNQICPGRIDTQRVRELDADRAKRDGISIDEVRSRNQSAIPLRRYGRPEELGAAVAFLASEQAGYLTGVTLQVDGGMVRHVT